MSNSITSKIYYKIEESMLIFNSAVSKDFKTRYVSSKQSIMFQKVSEENLVKFLVLVMVKLIWKRVLTEVIHAIFSQNYLNYLHSCQLIQAF